MNLPADQKPSPLFSIVIPSYNYVRYIGRAIESVLAQPGIDYEILVVDDGSSDGTSDIVRSYQDRPGRNIKYVYQENRGLGAARNRGVQIAVGEYLLFLDADDALLPGVVAKLRSFLQSNGGYDYIVGDHILVHTRGKIVRRRAPRIVAEGAANVRAYFNGNFTGVCNGSVLVRRSVFKSIQFPESIRRWQDRVFYSHLFARYRGASVDFPFLTVYRHDDSLSHQVASILEDAPKSVRLLFDPEILPNKLMSLEREYIARTQMFLFRTCYSRGLHQEARRAFHNAFKARPYRALRPQPLRRYLKTLFSLKRVR